MQPTTRPLRGDGFTILVPKGWAVGRARATSTARHGASLVSVTRYALRTSYAPTLFGRTAKELDLVARKLAAQAGGTLTQATTTTVDGQRVRAYRFTGDGDSGSKMDLRVGFVLRGRREFELLCQTPAGSGDPDGACALLFESFSAIP